MKWTKVTKGMIVITIILLSILGYWFNNHNSKAWEPDEFYRREYSKGRGKLKNRHNSLKLSEWINTYPYYENEVPDLFFETRAKKYKSSMKQLHSIYGRGEFRTFYTGCAFKTYDNNKYRRIFLDDCIENVSTDSNLNGWEHVNPQSILNVSTIYTDLAKSDLHNLRPSLQVDFNAKRSNYMYGVVESYKKWKGAHFNVGKGIKTNALVCEPRESIRGDIARITFYMHDVYRLKYDLQYYKMLIRWAQLDPVSKEEKILNQRIYKVQGNLNPYISHPEIIPHL